MKYLSIIRYVLLVVSVFVVIQGVTAEVVTVDLMLNWAYALMAVTIGLSIILPVFNFAKNPAGAARSLGGLVVVAAIVGTAYAMSDATPITSATGDVYDNVLELRLSDTGLYTTYFAFGAAVVSILLLEVYNMFK